MGSNPIILTDGNHGLKFGLTSVGVDGPYLYGFNAGALGTTDGGDDVSLAWSQTEVNIYKNMDMNGNNITNVSSFVGVPTGGGATMSNIQYIFFNASPNNAHLNGTGGGLYMTNYAGDININPTTYNINLQGAISETGTLNMNNSTITGVSSISAFGELSISANNDILTSAVSTINTVAETVFTGGISRQLISDLIPQPVLQYGQVSSSGGSGTITITMPTRYTSVDSFVAFAIKADSPGAEIYVSTLSRASFEIGWTSGGSGSHLFNWQTMGT
jgi:hypothetical protein